MPDDINQNIVTVVDPSGQIGKMPLADFEKARDDGHSYQLVQVAPKLTDADIAPDDHVNVIDPQGTPGTMPMADWQSGGPSQSGFKLLSQVDKEKQRTLDETEDLATLKRSNTLGLASASSEAATKHAGDDILTLHNQFKLSAPNGEDVDIGKDDLLSKLNQGYTFRDPQFQSLVQAHIKSFQNNPGLINQLEVGARQAVDTALFGATKKAREWDQGAIDNITTDNDRRAQQIASQLLTATDYGTARSVGTGVGIVGPVLGTGGAGIFGEGALGARLASGAGAGAGATFLPNGIRGALGAGVEGASLARRVGAGIASEAVAGGVIAAPQAISNLVLNHDPAQAGEALAWGIGTGGVVGIGAGALGRYAVPSAGQMAKNIVKDDPMRAFALQEIAEHMETTPQEAIGKMTEGSNLQTAQKLRLGSPGSITQAFSRAGEEEQQASPELSKAIEEERVFHTAEGTEVPRAEAIKKLEKIVDNDHPSFQTTMEKMDSAVDRQGNMELRPNSESMIEKLEEIKTNLVEDKLTKPMFREIDNVIEHIQAIAKKNEESYLSFKDVSDLDNLTKNKVSDRELAPGSAQANLNGVRNQIASITRNELINKASAVAEASDDPKLIQLWQNQKALMDNTAYMQKTLDDLKTKAKLPDIFNRIGHHGVIGSTIALFSGHPAGAATLAGILGTKHLATTFIENNRYTKLKSFYKRSMDSPNLGAYLAIDANSIAQKHINDIPMIFRTAADEGVAKYKNSNGIKDALGEEANGLSKEQQFKKLAYHVTTMATNPDISNAHNKSLSAPLKAHPELQAQFEAALKKKQEYLYRILPKNPQTPQPFSHDPEWKPSAAELDDFQKQVAVANNPFHVLEELKSGTLTSSQVATLSAINPAILAKMREEINKMAYGVKKPELTYQQKLSTAVLLGQSIDYSLTAIPQLQSVYGQQQQPQPSAPAGKSKGGSKLDNSKLPSSKTLAQRLGEK